MPALYPAKPWSRGVPPSTSGQLEKCGIGLSLRWRGEKPVDPCLGRCSFGIRHPSAESGLSSRTMSRGRSVATPWRCLQGQKDRARISGIHGGIARERLVDALGRPYGGAVYNSLEREGFASWETRAPASRSTGSTDERLRLRFLRLGDLEDERLNDRLVFFLVEFLSFRFRERPPERFHPRVVVFVAHSPRLRPRISRRKYKTLLLSGRLHETEFRRTTARPHVSAGVKHPQPFIW